MNEGTRQRGTTAGAGDEEILRAFGRRMVAVEALIPAAPAWQRPSTGQLRRSRVRGNVRFAAAPLVLVAALVTVGLAVGLGGRSSAPGASPTPERTGLLYVLSSGDGQPVAGASLDETASIMAARLDLLGVSGEVTKSPPDQIRVSIDGAVDLALVRAVLSRTGAFELVPLPAEDYGTSDAPGQKPVPAVGSQIDPSLPAIARGADMDPGAYAATLDPSLPGVWMVTFGLSPAKSDAFDAWTAQHVHEYLAIVIDGVVQNVPYIYEPLTGGKGQISGNFTEAEAKALSIVLRSGALPVPVAEVVTTFPDGSAGGSGVTAPTPTPIVYGPGGTNWPPNVLDSVIAGAAYQLDPGARIQIVVWTDFKCSGCAAFHNTVLDQLIARYVDTNEATITFVDWDVIDPSTGGHESLDAANAARCAADQGRYLEYADLVFSNAGAEGDGSLTKDRLVALGLGLDLDQNAFASCVRAGSHDADVQASSAFTAGLGLPGVPAVAVDGAVLSGWDLDTISRAVDASLARWAAATSTPAPQPSAAPTNAVPSGAATTGP
jgi:protein-disulfide isomerase